VQAICDFVHNHITFGYEHSRATRTASEAYVERHGVCRDYAHLAVAFCRSLNIPARYCTGYLTDIGLPSPYAPMDFAAWIEVYLGGRWHTFDPRNNVPRIAGRGRDSALLLASLAWAGSGACHRGRRGTQLAHLRQFVRGSVLPTIAALGEMLAFHFGCPIVVATARASTSHFQRILANGGHSHNSA
jgi:hypothetical protein